MDDWKSKLENIVKENKTNDSKQGELNKDHFEKSFEFLKTIVLPAFQELKIELEKYNREVNIFGPFDNRSIIEVKNKKIIESNFGRHEYEESFRFGIRVQNYSPFVFYSFYNPGFSGNSAKETGISENVSLRNGNPNYAIEDIRKDEIINKFLLIFKDFI